MLLAHLQAWPLSRSCRARGRGLARRHRAVSGLRDSLSLRGSTGSRRFRRLPAMSSSTPDPSISTILAYDSGAHRYADHSRDRAQLARLREPLIAMLPPSLWSSIWGAGRGMTAPSWRSQARRWLRSTRHWGCYGRHACMLRLLLGWCVAMHGSCRFQIVPSTAYGPARACCTYRTLRYRWLSVKCSGCSSQAASHSSRSAKGSRPATCR